MKRVDVYFLLLAGIMLVAGVILGMNMAMTRDFQLMPVHAHTNLVGWASLALFGLTYRAYPQLKTTVLARIHFALAAAAALLMPYGIYRAVVMQSQGLAMVAATTWFLAVLVFLLQLIRLTRTSAD